jgi:hypothetical protein
MKKHAFTSIEDAWGRRLSGQVSMKPSVGKRGEWPNHLASDPYAWQA